MSKQDINVDGPNSPISLKKVLADPEINNTIKTLTVFVDGTGMGIAKDDPNILNITAEECAYQATYFANKFFTPTQQILTYLYKYLTYIFIDGSKEYSSDFDLETDMKNGTITKDSEDYKTVVGLIKYCGTNKEAGQVIGLIQLIAGSLKAAKKAGVGVRLYLEHPETHLHPKRQSRFMSMLYKLDAEYGDGSMSRKNSNNIP